MLWNFKDKLVVDLEQHLGVKLMLRQILGKPDHGHLHDVGRRALERHVDSHAFGSGSALTVWRNEIGENAPAATWRFHVAVARPKTKRTIEVLSHLRQAGPV